jgi:hypothetical protein
MNLELQVDGEAVIKIELNATLLTQILQMKSPMPSAETIAKSAALTKVQVEELLSRIDAKSVHFLKAIAANNGSITWGEMRKIFGIADVKDWATYSSGHGKGITRALRNILNDKSARLIWWDDEEWEIPVSQQDSCNVYVDGAALQALREVSGLARSEEFRVRAA